MAGKSTLDRDNLAIDERPVPKGHDTGSLGPSDSSDSGSDVVGTPGIESDTDRYGTGELATARKSPVQSGRDVDTDRVVDAEEAGVVEEPDQAAEAFAEADEEERSVSRG
jgi:hypothetical protein